MEAVIETRQEVEGQLIFDFMYKYSLTFVLCCREFPFWGKRKASQLMQEGESKMTTVPIDDKLKFVFNGSLQFLSLKAFAHQRWRQLSAQKENFVHLHQGHRDFTN